jgi:hypothetical protein
VLNQRIEKPENNNFTEGSYLHCLVLEPEHVETRYAIYPGLRKAGAAYQAFKAEHEPKQVISAVQDFRVRSWLEAVNKNALALELLSGGFAEKELEGVLLELPVKIKADYININARYIVDVKTTAHPSETELFKQTVLDYGYELSAAMYTLVSEQTHGIEFDFYFVVISKYDLGVKVYKMSQDTRQRGKDLLTQALVKFKECTKSGDWSTQERTFIAQEDVEYV